jgi:hypothetical protein
MSKTATRINGKLRKSKQFNSDHIERAIADAEKLVDYAARSNKRIPPRVFSTLVNAKKMWLENRWTEEFTMEFWKAFQKMNVLIQPTTMESVRALNQVPKEPGLRGFLQDQYGRSEAGRAITRYTLWTLLVLTVVLVLQIYWVIGNSLTIKLSELLERESELANAIHLAELKYDELEVLFKLKENEDNAGKDVSNYVFYETPDWERETLQTESERQLLTQDLQTLKIQLERNFSILEAWAFAWDESVTSNGIVNDSIQNQMEQIKKQIDDHDILYDVEIREVEIETKKAELAALDERLLALEAQQAELGQVESAENDPNGQDDAEKNAKSAKIGESATSEDPVLEVLRGEITEVTTQRTAVNEWLDENTIDNYKIEKEEQLVKLIASKESLDTEHKRWVAKEKVRRLRLSADFVLVILQSYLLPVLYGLLGASVFVLRKLMNEIKHKRYNPDRSYVLRLALGTLSGLIIGWFVFLLPGQSVVGALPPMALAFLVGYNIEILFAQMDKLIAKFGNGDDGTQKESENNGDQVNGNGQAENQNLAAGGAQ